jgi:hypothetical protein
MHGPFPYLIDDLYVPGPGCSVTLSFDTHTRPFPALLDSGADLTSVPLDIIEEFQLYKEGDMPVSGATGAQNANATQGIYLINIEFPDFPDWTVAAHPVLGGEGSAARDYVLIGRDILNRHRISLLGPEQQFIID